MPRVVVLPHPPDQQGQQEDDNGRANNGNDDNVDGAEDLVGGSVEVLVDVTDKVDVDARVDRGRARGRACVHWW